MEKRKITDIQDLIGILEFYKRNNNWGVFNKNDIYESIFDILKNSNRFGITKIEQVIGTEQEKGLDIDTLIKDLQIVSGDKTSTVPGRDVLDQGAKQASDTAEKKRQADVAAKASVERTIKQAETLAKQKQQVEVQERPNLGTWTVAPEVKPEIKPEFVTGGAVVYLNPVKPPEPIKIDVKLEEKINEAKKDPEFIKNFTEFFEKIDESELPPGIDSKTVQAVAVPLALDLKANKIPAIDIDAVSKTAPTLPNPVSANLAVITNDEIMDKTFGNQKETVLPIMAQSLAHDAIWLQVQKQMVNTYFESKDASVVFYGSDDQQFQVSDQQLSTSGFQIDLNETLNHAQEISQIFSQTPAQASESIMNNFSDISFKPNFDSFFQDTSKLTSSIMDLFGKPSAAGELAAPSINSQAALNYLGLLPKMSPELNALMFDQIQLASVTFGKLPFGLTGGELSVNAGLFNGLSFGFTPAATATTQAAASTAAGTAGTVATTTATTAAVEAGAAATAGATAGTTAAAAGATAGAVAGSAIPVIGTVIGAVAGLLASLLPKIKEEFDKHSGDFAAVLIGGGMFGLMMGNPFLAVGGLAIGIPTAFLTGLGPKSLLSKFANGLGALFTGAVLPEIKAPLIGFLVGFPIFVAFILFVINSGAYVVPPQINSVTGAISPGLVASGSCPIVGGGNVTTGSYNPETEFGHGSNAYWKAVGRTCSFDIPIPGSYPAGCKGPTREENPQGTNICLTNGTAPLCPYYGFAADVVPVQGPNPGAQIVLPTLCEPGQTDCAPLTWTYTNGFWNCLSSSSPLSGPPTCATPAGKGTIWDAEGNGHHYRIYLNHIDNITAEIGQSYPSGTIIGETANIVGPHLHIELVIDGVPVRPDFLCNGASTGGVGGNGSPILDTGLTGYFIESDLSPSNVVVSSPYEYGKTTCDWAGIKNLTSSINANFFDAASAPIGPAGYRGLFTNYLSSAQAQKYTLQSLIIGGGGGQITSSYGLTDLKLQSLDAVVTGITYNSAIEEVRPRTAIGINGNKLLMMVTNAATPSKVKEVMDKLGATQSFLLDGGSSTTYCQGGALKLTGNQDGKPSVVSVSLGVKSGIVHELKP